MKSIKIDITAIISFVLGAGFLAGLLYLWQKSPFDTALDIMQEEPNPIPKPAETIEQPRQNDTPVIVLLPNSIPRPSTPPIEEAEEGQDMMGMDNNIIT